MLALALILSAALAPDFDADLRRAQAEIAALRPRLAELELAGDLAGAEALLLGATPEEQRTAAHCLQLGNLYVAIDPGFARRMHGRAFELEPLVPAVRQEWAIELQREARHAEALALYEGLARARQDPFVEALRAECLLQLGRETEALAAWKSASANRALAKLLPLVPRRLSREDSRERTRAKLRAELAAGRTGCAEELVFRDLPRPGSRWRYAVERTALEQDRALARGRLEAGSRRLRELEATAEYWTQVWSLDFRTNRDSTPSRELAERARELGWLAAGAEPPANGHTLLWTVEALLAAGVASGDALLAEWERTLAGRLEEGDREAGTALLTLQRAAGDARRAHETEESLWRRLRDEPAVAALLESRAERLRADDALLKAALAEHPRSPRLCRLASECARREGAGERQALAREIQAWLGSSAELSATADLTRIEDAFARLGEVLAAPEAR